MTHYLDKIDITACGRNVTVGGLNVTADWHDVGCSGCQDKRKRYCEDHGWYTGPDECSLHDPDSPDPLHGKHRG